MTGKQWDKLRTWNVLKDEIEQKLKEPEKFDTGITLEIGPQLLQTFRHRSELRCINHSVSKLGEVFTTHYNKGDVQRISVWSTHLKSKDGAYYHLAFNTQYELTSLTYVARRRVYVGFSTDLCLRLFTDANSSFTETVAVPFTASILCLVYNRDEEEIYAGGTGFIEEWRVTGAEHSATLVPGRKFITTDINRNDWIRDVILDRNNNQMFAVHSNGILVFNFKTRIQTHRLPNRHEGPLKCCCYFSKFDYLITGGADGKIRIFNGTTFSMIHILVGHYGPVTSVESHKKEPLLFSCSHDGTVRLWRMDTLKIFTRLEIGERIHHLSLLGDTEFFFQTEKNIMIYTQNQFYQFFSSVASEPYKLMCCRGKGKPNRILVSAEDGSLRVLSPVTGLTLTIVYPMPSFQILTQIAYDIFQERLYTVMQGGNVLVYNTSTNPCKSEEMWLPSRKDEEVTNILLISVGFTIEEVIDVDNLVFAGLNNGQIILCESVVCSLKYPVQAHEGSLLCLESSTAPAEGRMVACSRKLVISGGKDCYMKIWKIFVSSKKRRPEVELDLLIKIFLPSVPTHICMCGEILAVSIKTSTHLGCRWRLVMYKLTNTFDRKSSLDKESTWYWRSLSGTWTIPLQITHPPDEDHSLELTALDKCAVINVFLTAGKDGFVKIWNKENQLLREMNFAMPIHASCFANSRGDVLVGYGTQVCCVSVINYLPLENLTTLYHSTVINIKDDGRELPVKINNAAEPWLDFETIKKYPIDISERRKRKIEEEVIASLKQEAADKFVIFYDSGTTRVIRKAFADRLLGWARGKIKFRLGFKPKSLFPHSPAVTELTEKEEDESEKKQKSKIKYLEPRGVVKTTDKEEAEITERKYLDSEKLIEIYPPVVGEALRALETEKFLTPLEMRLLDEKKLMERDPIIAPDGYIPNSVIRSRLKLKPLKQEPPRAERRWKLKPVPKADPSHLPAGWDIIEKEKEKTPPPRLVVLKWEDTPSPEASEVSSVSSVSIKSPKPPTPPKLLKKFVRECHAKPKSETKSAKSSPETPPRIDKSRGNTQLSKGSTLTLTPFVENKASDTEKKYRREDSLRRSDRLLRRTPIPKPEEGVEATPEESGYDMEAGSQIYQMKSRRTTFVKEGLRRKHDDKDMESIGLEKGSADMPRRDSKWMKGFMELKIIKQLVAENWMPKVDCIEDEYDDVLSKLISSLDTQKPEVFGSAIDYLNELFRQLGINKVMLNDLIETLKSCLDHLNSEIRRHALKGLQVLGAGRKDVIQAVLTRLIDEEEDVRNAAVDAIQCLTEARDKESLFKLLDGMGITDGVYSSREDEEYALRVLAEKLAEGTEDPEYTERLQERILDWVETTTPGMISDDMNPEDLEQLWKDGTRSGKSSMYKSREQSFLSEKSVVETSGLTMYADLPTTPGFSSELSELCLSRGVSKSGELHSAKSRYNARMGLMDLMDRSGAVHVPGERWEPPTPVTQSGSSDHDPSLDDPLLQLQMEKSNLTNLTNESQSFDNIKVTERTLTNLSQVGPLPSFMPRGNSDGKSYDVISMDSAIESGFSASEYEGLSHYSEMLTFSHTDQQSFKDSVLSETNEQFDVEHESEVEAETVEDTEAQLQEEPGDREDSAGQIWGIYFGENLERIMEAVEEVIITPLPALEEILETYNEEEEEGDKQSSKGGRGPSKRSGSKKSDTRSAAEHKLREMDNRSVVSERSLSSRGSKDLSEMSNQHEETETDRQSSVMVIITPRGEIVRSVISVDGHTVTPRDVVKDTVVEEDLTTQNGSKTALSDPICIPPPQMSSFMDKSTYVTEKNFSKQGTDKHHPPRVYAPSCSRMNLPQVNEQIHYSSVNYDDSSSQLDILSVKENDTDAEIITDPQTLVDILDNNVASLPESTSHSNNESLDIDSFTNSRFLSESPIKSPVTKIEISVLRNLSPLGLSQTLNPENESNLYPMKTGISDCCLISNPQSENVPTYNLKHGCHTKRKVFPQTENDENLLDVFPQNDITNQKSDLDQSLFSLHSSDSKPVILKNKLESKTMKADDESREKTEFQADLCDSLKPGQDISDLPKSDSDLPQYTDEASADSRLTPKDPSLYRHYDREKKPLPDFHEENKRQIHVEDSDYKTMSQIPSSQIMERLSGQDSGISRDMSDFSRSRDTTDFKGKAYPYGASLSPVKSEGSNASEKQHPKDWRKFFELPTAVERHQIELIKREMAQGKLKHTTLPPISYFAKDLPMLPGEAGTRLLQTVRIGEKIPTSGDGRHRIEPVPGKLAVHTKNESEGLSCFGIIQMEWTTGVPTVKDATYPPQRIPQYRYQSEDIPYLSSLHGQLSHLDRTRQGTSETELHLPNLPTATASSTVSHRLSPSFEWELPLPPPPAKESRTVVPYIKKEHDTYCKYYQLVKKKLHLYTSPLGFIPALIAAEKARPKPKKQREKSLPAVVAKGLTEKQSSESLQTRQSRDSSSFLFGSGRFLPPIKLGQLINI